MTNLEKFLRMNMEERIKAINDMFGDVKNDVEPIFCRAQPDYLKCTKLSCMKCVFAWLKQEAEDD